MAHWPKTVRGKLFALSVIAVAAPLLWMLVVALSGPIVWASLAAIALVYVGLRTWYQRVQTTHYAAVADGFSFGDVVRRMRAADVAGDPRSTPRDVVAA
jgi:hypothetical protein